MVLEDEVPLADMLMPVLVAIPEDRTPDELLIMEEATPGALVIPALEARLLIIEAEDSAEYDMPITAEDDMSIIEEGIVMLILAADGLPTSVE